MVTAADVRDVNSFDSPALLIILASISGTWCFFIAVVQAIGIFQISRHYSTRPGRSNCEQLPSEEVPHVTVLRPVKGVEPQLYECLASTFRQTYPQEKLTVYFCVASVTDPAYPILEKLLVDFPGFDARLYVEEQDPNLSRNGAVASQLGPNPKIRNMSRGYREAKGDIIWILDCNVWVGRGVAGRMVDRLCGIGHSGKRQKPFKFVHQLPLVIDAIDRNDTELKSEFALHKPPENFRKMQSDSEDYVTHQMNIDDSAPLNMLRFFGGQLEEMFMASTHAKFYTAINTVSIAPCIVGKSNMFRRSHLDYLTSNASSYSPGIDFFSDNICEDHLIGDLLWRKKVPEEEAGVAFGKHALLFGDLAIQPMAQMSFREYLGRRVRWLRVRKYTVTLATLVEPGVECLLCSSYAAFSLTTLPWAHSALGIPQTWIGFIFVWLFVVTLWTMTDRYVYAKLHSASSIEIDHNTPSFACRPTTGGRRAIGQWLATWWSRETLALPIWTWAVWGGATVVWRSKTLWVGMDMKVHEISERTQTGINADSETNTTPVANKVRRD